MNRSIRCPIVWYAQASFVGFVEADEVKLGISIVGEPEKWQAIAIQTSKLAATDILAEHSHEFLGDFKDFEKARRHGTLYARKWLAAKRRAKKCECGPIRKGRR